MDTKIEHLRLIQAVITRMASNSFLLKGWGVTLISAIFALAAGKSNRSFVFIAFFPAIMFWILDAYFLWQERLFRKLYDHIRALDVGQIDFSMDTTPFINTTSSWVKVFFSKTLLIFHGTVIAIIIIVLLSYCR